MTEYRTEQLAEAAGISVAALRSYQSQGLVPPPRHVGRIALYGEHHLDRLRRILELKARGHSLRAIAEHFDESNAARTTTAAVGDRLRLRDVAERSGMPIEMLRSLEASGVVVPCRGAEGPYYSAADVEAVECVLLLIGSGIPFDRFLEVAEPQLRAGESVATGATDLFSRFVVPRLHTDPTDPAAARRDAFVAMAGAIGRLAGYLVERQVLADHTEFPEVMPR